MGLTDYVASIVRLSLPVIEFCSYKWINPLDYMDGKDTKEMCQNKKWITIDDVNCDDNIPILIAKAFEKFIEEI